MFLPTRYAAGFLGFDRLGKLDRSLRAVTLVILSLSKGDRFSKLKRAADRIAKRVLGQILRERANAAGAPDKEQHAIALGRWQSEPATVDRVYQVARTPCKGGVRGADVVRNARATRTNQAKHECFVSGFAANV
jgi:hypothetical protein